MTIDTGDHVQHLPSGEEWLVAFVKDGRLCACGWPCSFVPVSDCVLTSKATAEKRAALLIEMASMSGDDPRKRYAMAAALATQKD